MNEITTKEQLLNIFHFFLDKYGKRYWWPGDTPLEVVFGCILTQNVSWSNVGEAIKKLKNKNLIDIDNLLAEDDNSLAELLISTRYYNQKASSLKYFCRQIQESFDGDMNKLFSLDIQPLRNTLLGMKGIGKETADSIILYAANKLIFVVDAYTKRIFSRLGFFDSNTEYDNVQRLFMANLPEDLYIYNEFHALIVKHGQSVCKHSKPLCDECITNKFCKHLL